METFINGLPYKLNEITFFEVMSKRPIISFKKRWF